ncbi:MAG TPA: lytic transglycosylase domain-containing protein [Thermoanaerobaculia bacterium]|nr:lytic transglycosylase domain-containing protein [Thermoanaerobaculia bacterium]
MRTLTLTLATLLLASTASASIALFSDGRNMKIEAYTVEEETIHLTMQGGGKLSLPIARIERIVDDEVTTPEIVEEVRKIVEEGGVFPHRSWRYHEQSQPLFQSKYNEIIIEASRHHDVDAALVSAVIKAESDYNPRIVSHKGARGLMQLMPATAKRFGVTNSFDPRENIFAGTRYLRWLLKKFDGNADFAVAAYNAGEGNVWKYEGVPPFRETVNYINRIAKHIRKAIETEVIPRNTETVASERSAAASVAALPR